MVVAALQKNKNKENHQMPPKFGGFCEEKILPPLPPLSEKYPLHLVGVEEGGGGQSRAQSFSGSLSAVGRREKLWDNGIFVPEILGHRL